MMRTLTLVVLLLGPPSRAQAAPSQIHLSWQGPAETTMTVTWRSSASTGEVEYGNTSSYGMKTAAQSAAFAGSYLHTVKLTGLAAGTAYHYRCGKAGDWSQDFAFRTGPKPGTPFRFVAMGDSRSNDAPRKLVCEAAAKRDPGLALHTGDFVADGTSQSQWDQFFKTMQPLAATTPFMGAIGNHEEHADIYYEQFAFPTHTPPASGIPDEAYYAFDYGNTHFISLSTEHEPKTGDAQYAWLKQDLIASAKKPHIQWVVVFAHRPPHSTGPHGDDAAVKAAWEHLFESFGVDVTFWGHDHTYERHLPLFQGHPVEKGGVIYIVTGGAGAPLYSAAGGPTTAFTKAVHHFVEVNVQGSQMKIEAREPDGTIFDTLTLSKTRPKPTWIMDGSLDSAAKKLGSGAGAELKGLHAGFDGRYLYVATDGMPASMDHFILLSDTKPAKMTQAPWRKTGGVWGHAMLLAMEAVGGYSAWQDRHLIPFGSSWKYHDQGTDQGTAWRAEGFDDSAWKSGPGQLGYGDGDEATKLYDPDPNYPSVYFRKKINLAQVPSRAMLTVLHDDGVAVWINGKLVLSKLVDNGTSYGAWASGSSSENALAKVVIDQASQKVFKAGQNTFAVMVKQVSGTSSDISFDLQLQKDHGLTGHTWAGNPAGTMMEGMVDLEEAFGAVPETVYLAAAAYGSAEGGALGEQIPAGNANGDLESGEWIELKIETQPSDGGVPAEGGAPDDATAIDGAITTDGNDEGCGCTLGRPATRAPTALLLLLVLLFFAAARRRWKTDTCARF